MADAYRQFDAYMVARYGQHPVEKDDWWATTILHEFRFLDAYGFTLESISFHQAGNFLVFRGPCHRLDFEYSSGGGVCNGTVGRRGTGEFWSLDRLPPTGSDRTDPPPLDYDDIESVQARIRYWAVQLKQLAPTLLECEPGSG